MPAPGVAAAGRAPLTKLQFTVHSVSGEARAGCGPRSPAALTRSHTPQDPDFPAAELQSHSPNTRGWQTPRRAPRRSGGRPFAPASRCARGGVA